MAHHKRKKPRAHARTGRVERARDEKLGAARRFYDSCPAWHRITFITRPKRRENKRLERKAMKSEAPNELVWPVGNRKPHFFYW